MPSLGLLVTICLVIAKPAACLLYPRESSTREIKSLDGIWNFRLDDGTGLVEEWYKSPLAATGDVIPMPVPASYNDIYPDKNIRDHTGLVWYERTFFVPSQWQQDRRVWLRFGSVCYAAQVWIGGDLVVSHKIGHLPFEVDVSTNLKYGEENVITVAVDNTLTSETIPQGSIKHEVVGNDTYTYQSYTFDFFNYAGIDRPVLLYTSPLEYIDDVTVITGIGEGGTGQVNYDVSIQSTADVDANITLRDKEGIVVATSNTLNGTLEVPEARLWWPYLMDPEPGYLYQLQIDITSASSGIRDSYRLPIGIRTLYWDNSTFTINGKPIYFRGFGRHEDFFIKGKGLDLSLVTRDYSLLKWIGANSYRTSHYPYAEEIMDMADREGIMIIDECPSVNADIYLGNLLANHKQSLTELYNRDKNRPSVVVWSVANEPVSQRFNAADYFKEVVSHIKSLDPTRPTTIAEAQSPAADTSAEFLDIVSFNRYNSWYSDAGRTEVIYQKVVEEAEAWREKHNKPVLVTEYGAEAIPGLHKLPGVMFSEEYQLEALSENFRAFDELRSRGWFYGEMIWNFADFLTSQGITRVDGNHKGIFTRDRQPKAPAPFVRQRYFALAKELDNAEIPNDLHQYVKMKNCRDEL